MRKIKVCPKCRNIYPDIGTVMYCICGHKFTVVDFSVDALRQMSKDAFGEDLFSGFDIREG